ncbi:MAG: sugar-binding protein, partial [Gemmatimonadales bacterium]
NPASYVSKASPNGTLNATGTDVGYTVELRISWNDLGVTTPAAGLAMRVDLAVDDRDGSASTTEEFDWANLTTTFNNPSAWKDVQLVDAGPIVPVYDLVKVGSSGMTIDGNLADWAGVPAIAIADDPANGRGGANNSANVRMVWNDTYLFAAYDVTDTELLAVQTAHDNADIYKDDAVELYIDPQGDGGAASHMTTTDYQLLANIRDALGENRGAAAGGKDASFNPASYVSKASPNGTLNATGTDVGYTVELRISWSDLGVTAPAAGRTMLVDLAVDDRDGQATTTEEFDWANLTTTFNNPSAWKGIRLTVDGTAPAAPTSPALTVVSSSQIDVAWTASSSPDAAAYRIYRGTGPTATPTLLTTVSGSPFQNTGLTASTTYRYQISTLDAAGNESAKTAIVSATTGGSGTPLRIGLSNTLDILGQGPGGNTAAPIYKVALGIPTPSTIVSKIATANALDITLVLNLAGGRQTWTNQVGSCLNYDQAKYRAEIDQFRNIPELTSAFASRRAVIYLVDEPQIADFCNTLTPALVNAMGTYVKSIWPGVITMVRSSVRYMSGGWAGSGTLGFTFWTGVDYGWAQYESQHIPSAGETPAQFFAREKQQLRDLVNLGMVPGHNIWSGGTVTCWDYLFTGSSSGRIWGTFSQNTPPDPPGKTASCSTPYGQQTRWSSTPAIVRSAIDAAFNDPDAPFFNMWTHTSSSVSYLAPYVQYENRNDFISALDYTITKGATRSTWNGWRPAK